ncbi:MAG: glycosyltransferase family 4 protein [Acidobacteriota bacterium]|nr:glycosyltransferase family 4 protein [Acidobacteriota bacterium]
MRILQICSAKTIGGGERHVADLSNLLSSLGFEVFVALTHNSPLRNLLLLPPENFIVTRLRNAIDIFSAQKLAKFVSEKKIEIIHAHTGRDYLPAAICSALSGKPFVLTRHVLFPMKRMNSFFLRRTSGVIAVSNAVSRSLLEQKIFPADKIKIVHNGIDTKRFVPAAQKVASKTFRIGTIGELSAIKGHEIFITAAAKVLRHNPKVEFEIVGEDKTPEKKTQTELEKIIKKFNLEDSVKLHGWIDDVVPFLHSLDAFVSASRFDAFGLAICEAMACSIPVIASDTEAAREIIEHGETGLLFSVNKADVLADKILDLIKNPAHGARLGIAARARIESEFSLEKMAARTVEFYKEALGGS